MAEAVYRYNVMPRSDDLNSSPANVLFNYKLRVPDVESEEKCEESECAMFSVGDKVWIRDPSRRCDVPSSIGTVTRQVSAQCVEVDNVPRHVRDLRLAFVPSPESDQTEPPNNDNDDSGPIILRECAHESHGENVPPVTYAEVLRRGMRERRPAVLTQYDDL